MEFDEGNDKSYDSYASDDTSESDFDFDYDVTSMSLNFQMMM